MTEHKENPTLISALKSQTKRRELTSKRLDLIGEVNALEEQKKALEEQQSEIEKAVGKLNQQLDSEANNQKIALSTLQTDFINNSRYLKDLYHLIEFGADTLAVKDKMTLYSALEVALAERRKMADVFSEVYTKEDYQSIVHNSIRVKTTAKAITSFDLEEADKERKYTARSVAFTSDLTNMLANIKQWETKFPNIVLETNLDELRRVKSSGVNGTV